MVFFLFSAHQRVYNYRYLSIQRWRNGPFVSSLPLLGGIFVHVALASFAPSSALAHVLIFPRILNFQYFTNWCTTRTIRTQQFTQKRSQELSCCFLSLSFFASSSLYLLLSASTLSWAPASSPAHSMAARNSDTKIEQYQNITV